MSPFHPPSLLLYSYFSLVSSARPQLARPQLASFHQVVGGSPDMVSFLLLFWSIVVSCVVACLPLAPEVLGFANLRSFGCCPLAYFRVPAACGSPVPSYFLTPLFHVIYAVHCCTLLSVCLRYASATRGGMSGACHIVSTYISQNGTVSHT